MTNTKNLAADLIAVLNERGHKASSSVPGYVFVNGFGIWSNMTGKVLMQDVRDKDYGRALLGTCEDSAETLADAYEAVAPVFYM